MAAISTVFARLINASTTTKPIAVTFKDAAKYSGLSESHLRFLASERGGRVLASSTVGRKRLIDFESLERLIKP